MAQGVGLGRVGWPAAQCCEDLRALALKRLRKLAQIVQSQPKGEPRLYQVRCQPESVGEQRPQRGQPAQGFDAHGRHVEAVVR